MLRAEQREEARQKPGVAISFSSKRIMADPSESDLGGKLGVGTRVPLVKKCVLRDYS